jgi:hypothetical protein
VTVRVRRSRDEACAGCGRRIPWWWFKLGDRQGWWHVLCMLRDCAR